MARLAWYPQQLPDINSPQCRTRIGDLQGVMLHYDASSSDAGSLAWFRDPRCRVSYNEVVLDDGSWCYVAVEGKAAYHAGRCRPSSEHFDYHEAGTSYRHTANHAFYGVCIANAGKEDVTPRQMLTVAWRVALRFAAQGWSMEGELWRITSHRAEAWERGRKSDPEGGDLTNPILSPGQIQELVPLVEVLT